ncbi:hypothetical protein JTB14_030656 [Gonioctena quinquepunctata]|nr:hypothetical protein JTB14_030656 [Gonioctena quinquepunctata]
MKSLTLLFLFLFSGKHSCYICDTKEDLYCLQPNLNRTSRCVIESAVSDSNVCSKSGLPGIENLKSNFGDVVLQIHSGATNFHLTTSIYPEVLWTETKIRLSEYNKKDWCKVFTVTKAKDNAYNLKYVCEQDKLLPAEPFLMEIDSENDEAHKKILFNIPNSIHFNDSVPPKKRSIFSYVDFTNTQKIVLKIQPLPAHYAVTHYKVEVFREREDKSTLLDVRLIPARLESVLDFEYNTYNEEGYYCFAVSVISEECPEDTCLKSFTPKLHISRKGTPLVIGIVGASFFIPFVLFIFYVRHYRNRSKGVPDNIEEKILIIYKPSMEKHNEAVASLAKTIENLTGIEVILDPVNLKRPKEKTVEKPCNDDLIFATYILYVNPPALDDSPHDLDCMTYYFLNAEIRNLESRKKIVPIFFPYSWRESPYFLGGCSCVSLMEDFSEFISIFPLQRKVDYLTHPHCVELTDKIEAAALEMDHVQKVLPKIVVTEQAEVSDEPREVDVLL